jgi:hypothetical protein
VTNTDSVKYIFANAIEKVDTETESVVSHSETITSVTLLILIHHRSIKRDATQNHRSAYIFEEMRPAYRDCSIDSGMTKQLKLHCPNR